MADESHIQVGDNIAGFEILAKIAEGGMGAVYKARQVSLDRIVAIKILPPRLAKDEQFVRHFQEESRVAARLKHPHLIEVYDAGKTDGTHYFAMEFVEGETVGDRLRRDGPFVEHLAVGICLNVAQALQYAWEKSKLIHGDIKPENLLIERETKKVRIGDLGLGKSLLGRSEEDIASDQRRGMGTPAYVCPEQARGDKHLDFRADMYALGATMYHMLTGKLPFEGLNAAETLAGHLQGHLPDPRSIRPAISERTVIVLERMLAREADQRYPTWAALAHDLEQVHQGRSPSVPPLPAGRSTLRRDVQVTAAVVKKKTSPVVILIELLVIATGLALFYWYAQTHPKTESSSTPSPGTKTASHPTALPPSARADEFLPTRLAGLRGWLRADKDIAHDEQNRVSTWGDQSVNGWNATQNNADERPVLVREAFHGKPAIRFDGINDSLNLTPFATSNFTVAIAFSISALKPWAGPMNNRVKHQPGFQIVSGDGSPQRYVPALITWNGEETTSARRSVAHVTLPAQPMIHTWVHESDAGSRFFEDGIETRLGECRTHYALFAACLGRGFDYMAGDIAEVVVYDRALTGTELQSLQKYLEAKYNIVPSRANTPDDTPPPSSPAAGETKPEGTTPKTPIPAPSPESDAKALADAENRYRVWRAAFEEMLKGGEYTRARETAASAQADPGFSLVKGKIARDENIARMILDLRSTAWTNLLGQTYYVGSTPGTVARIESDKFWVKLSAGEIAVPFDKLDPAKLPSFALSKNRSDPTLNLGAALYSWYRGDKDIAKVYFDAAAKAGADVPSYLPVESSAPSSKTEADTPPTPTGAESEATGTNAPAQPVVSPDDGMNMLANHSFERWSGPTLLGWNPGNSQAKPERDTQIMVDGQCSARFDFSSNQPSMQLEQPFQAAAGRRYRLAFFYRAVNFKGQFWVEISAPGDPIPKLKEKMQPDSDWQRMDVELNVPSTTSLLVRVRASNASAGSIWLDHFDLRSF